MKTRFIILAVGVRSGTEGYRFLHLVVQDTDKKAALKRLYEEYDGVLTAATVYTVQEFEELSQRLLNAEPDPPWMQVSAN